MALTGLEIYKHLPKTNCKDCGLPTCLAFAMKMATKQMSLDKCPHVTAAGKAALESASRPPIQLVVIGSGDAGSQDRQRDAALPPRGEVPPPHGRGRADLRHAWTTPRLPRGPTAIGKLRFERVGVQIGVNLVAVDNDSGDAGRFEKAAAAGGGEVGPGLRADVGQGRESRQARPPHWRASGRCCTSPIRPRPRPPRRSPSRRNCPLAVRADGLDALADLTAQDQRRWASRKSCSTPARAA